MKEEESASNGPKHKGSICVRHPWSDAKLQRTLSLGQKGAGYVFVYVFRSTQNYFTWSLLNGTEVWAPSIGTRACC